MMQVVSLDTYEKEIRQGKKAGLLGAIHIGRALCAIQEGNLWLGLAKNFWKYCEQAHGFGKSTCYNLCAVYKAFGEKILADPSLQSIEPTRLIRLLPFVDDSNPVDLLNQAAHIPDALGFENQIRNMKNLTGTDDPHEHDFQPVNIQQCKICGLRRKG